MSYTDNRFKAKGVTVIDPIQNTTLVRSHIVRFTTTSANNTITEKDGDGNVIGTVLLYADGDTVHLEKYPGHTFTTTGSGVISSTAGTVSASNMIRNNIAFDLSSSGAWYKNNCTITANTTIAPDGTLTADTFTPTGSATKSYIYSSNNTCVSGTCTFSLYVKGTGFIQLFSNTFWAGNGAVTINCATGATQNYYAQHGSSTDCGNGWWRLKFSHASGNSNGTLHISSPDAIDTARNTAGSNTIPKYIWGAQFEQVSTLGDVGMLVRTEGWPGGVIKTKTADIFAKTISIGV